MIFESVFINFIFSFTTKGVPPKALLISTLVSSLLTYYKISSLGSIKRTASYNKVMNLLTLLSLK